MSEIMVVALATIFNAPLPILPLQILFLNLITDVFPALALGVGRGDPSVMDCPPRDKDEPILVRENWLAIGGYGVIITASVLAALWLAISHLGMGERQAVTVSFLTLAFAQLWHVFNMRHHNSNILKNDITKNPFLWGSLVLCSGLLVLAVYLPGLSTVLKVVNPGTDGWFIILGLSLIPLFIGQLFKLIKAFD